MSYFYVHVGKFGPVSELVQNVAFSHGWQWIDGGKQPHNHQFFSYLMFFIEELAMYNNAEPNEQSHAKFGQKIGCYEVTEWEKIVELLSHNTRIGTNPVKIYFDKIQVGCQDVTFDQVEGIYKKMVELRKTQR